MSRIVKTLFDPAGVVTGRSYFYAGVLLFVLKYALDALVVRHMLVRRWMPWDYLNIQWRDIDFRDPSVVRFATLMLALALPFIWCGVILTFKRLRALRWPAALVCLFFVPYVNIVLFLLLSFWPNGEPVRDEPAASQELGAAVSVIVILTLIAVGLVVFSTGLLEHYGWGLFVGTPFVIGFVPGLLHKTVTRHPLVECIFVGLATELFVGAALLMFAIEGLICLIMAAPLAISLSTFGTFIGYTVRVVALGRQRQREGFCAGAILVVPLLMLSEKAADILPGLIRVTTHVDIAAPPATVWKHVVAFAELPPPKEWIFRAGVAYPVRAEIDGSGPGAIRHCIFSTGAFVEPIQVWHEPRLLQFTVAASPRPMQELSFREVEPAHLDGFLRSEKGQFALIEIAPGQTRLEGTTWYRHGLWPERYWQFWSDHIIHTIHLRVLRHIKDQSESAAPATVSMKPAPTEQIVGKINRP